MSRAIRFRHALSVRLTLVAAVSAALLSYGIQPAAAHAPADITVTAGATASAEELPDEGSPGQGEPATRVFDDSPGTGSAEEGTSSALTSKTTTQSAATATVMATTTSSPTINRSRVIERAKSWVGRGLTYNQSGTHERYRRDCSGYISMAWGLATPGLTTNTFASRGVTYTITKDELRPGDALNNDNLGSSGHIVLFEGWTSSARTHYWGYEFTGTGVHHRQIPYPYFSSSNPAAYKAVRNRYVVDDPPSVPVPVNGDLYALTPDKSAVVVWNGSSWTAVGGAAADLYAGGAGLFATNPGDGGIYKYNGTPQSWTRIGNAGAAFAVSDRHLFALTPDRSAVMQWSGSGTGWTQIGGAAATIHAGAAGLFATHPGDGSIHRYNGTPNSWTRIGNAGAAFAVNNNALYGLTPDRSAVMRWTGSGDRWEQVGGPAGSLYAGGTSMVATDPHGGDVFRFNGTPGSWTQIGGPGAHFALSGTHIYGLTPNRSAVTVWTGSGWNGIGGGAAQIAAGR
ncbi:hypothetical protein ACFWG6_33765 [Streptomyces erythrochromogenes]|uniref:hypothetical protein n=1 Tax=Streptomyces erythrochromogenes TaxID=285574 RepID=UPI0036445493